MEQKPFLYRIQNHFPYFVLRQLRNGSQYVRGKLTTSTTPFPPPHIISLIFWNVKNFFTYSVEVTHAKIYFAVGSLVSISMVTYKAENLVPGTEYLHEVWHFQHKTTVMQPLLLHKLGIAKFISLFSQTRQHVWEWNDCLWPLTSS